MDDPQKRLLQLFVACGHPAELFQLANESFDLVALAVRLLVQATRRGPISLEGDHRLRAAIPAGLALRVAVEALVGDHFLQVRHPRRRGVEQRLQVRRFVRLAGHDRDGDRRVCIRRRQHDLAGETAAAAPQPLLRRRPFFFDAPAAWRCARMLVASTSTRFTSANTGLSVSTWNSRARLPLAIQRRKRLYTASQAPNSPGRSRHGMPVRATYNTASKNIRSDKTGVCPPLYRLAASTCGPRTVHSSSVII